MAKLCKLFQRTAFKKSAYLAEKYRFFMKPQKASKKWSIDLKSPGLISRAGSSPAPGTISIANPYEIDIEASPQEVWNILIDAESWPDWYEGALNVDVLDSTDGKLTSGSTFSWNTMGLDFQSVVKEFKPPYRLSWESKRSVIQGYHTWLIIPTAQGVKIITDESQHDFFAHLQPIFIPNKLRNLHDVWLAELKSKAENR